MWKSQRMQRKQFRNVCQNSSALSQRKPLTNAKEKRERSTINGDDIIWAITTLGFEDYVDPWKTYLQKYKEIEGEKINIPKQQRSEQRLHQQQHQHPHQDQNNNLPLSSVYSSPNLISQPPYVATDQLFFLPFSPNSIQKQLQPQDQIDSVGQW